MSKTNGPSPSKQLQDALNEIGNLRCKLDSKSRALLILSQDLLECKRERNEYKLVSDQVKEKYSSLRKRIDSFGSTLTGISDSNPNLSSTGFAQILCQLKEQNKNLLYELEETKTKLIDCEGDVRMLRGQLNSIKRRSLSDLYSQSHHGHNHLREKASLTAPGDEKQSLVVHLELIKNRNSMMEKDMQALLDEKEELIVSRDEYKAKVERLNERLNHLLKDSSSINDETSEGNMKTFDIEGIFDENNFLRGKIEQLEEEKNRLRNVLTKYRTILEKNNGTSNGFPFDAKLDHSSSIHRLSTSNVISSKQVQEFIASNNLNHLQLSNSTLVHLKSLVIALYEALTDKSTALALQRKNNKLLGERLEELEQKIKQLKAREKVYLLMKDYEKEVNLPDVFSPSEDFEEDLAAKTSEASTQPLDRLDGKHEELEEGGDSFPGDELEDEETQLPDNLEALIEEEYAKIKQSKS